MTPGTTGARRPGPAGSALRDRRLLWLLLALAAVAWSAVEAGLLTGDPVNEGGWGQVTAFLAAALHPETSPDFLARAGRAAFTTVAFAACGTVLSLILGAVGGILGSETWWRAVFRDREEAVWSGWRAPWLAVRAVLAVPRAIHEIIWGLFFLSLVGLDPLVGVLAIAIPYGAICAKVFSELLDEADRRSLDALLNRGVRPAKAFLYSLVPEAFPDLLSYAFYRFECSIRSAAVLGIIGAGGLGYEIFLSLQSLRYEQMWTFLLALVALTGLTDLWSGVLRRRMGSPHRIDITFDMEGLGEEGPSERRGEGSGPEGGAAPAGGHGRGAEPGRPDRDPLVRASAWAAAALLALAVWHVGPSFAQLLEPRTARMLDQVVSEAIPPTLGPDGWAGLLDLSLATLAMSILAIAGAAAAGVLLAYPAATNFLLPGGVLGERRSAAATLLGGTVWAATRGLLLFLRAVPAPIWALILLFVFFPGILPGALALALYTTGVLGRLMAEVVENLDARPLRALKAQGASGLQVFLYGVVPATAPRFLGYTLYRWEVSVRATAMVGLVGAGGLGRVLSERMSSFDYQGVLTLLLAYVVLTFLVDMVSALARRDLR